uniref:Suf domain-containing protein n=1 Tax=Syphacia muris TaxID=451379 RepID=A0A0N5ARA7_9BILA
MGRDDANSPRSGSRSRSDTEDEDHGHSHHHERSRSRSRSHLRHRERRRSDSSDRESDALKQYWNVVKEDSRNFDAWTQLLQYVEHLDDTKAARKAYDAFFKRYPYCYGYWRKYAEFERRHKHYERTIEVYERGVSAVGLSVDLWLHYLSYAQEIYQHQDNAVQKIRAIYDRALKACGMDFRSDKLWKEYISFEENNGALQRAGALYDLLFSTPTQLYSSHFERYQLFVNSYEPDRIISEEEYNEIFAEVEANLKKSMDGELFLIEEYEDETPSDCLSESGEQPAKKICKRRKHCEEALRVLRLEILERRRKKYISNEQEISLRWTFEENIKRPYFHVKPLERAQLRNWHTYLDFEISRGDTQRCIILFERCLVACAIYEEMWIKYARYLDKINDVQQARMVYRRATETHLPRNANLHLAYSAFEENHGDPEKASHILSEFDHRHPGYGIIALRRIGIERRLAKGQAEDGRAPDYSQVISRFERLIHDPLTPTKISTFYALKLARFHARIRNDRKLAEKIIKDAITRDKENPDLYLTLLDLKYTVSPLNEDDVLAAFDYALSSDSLSVENKLRFSQRKLDFLEDLGTSITKLQEHLEFHMKLQKSIEVGGTKRKADSRTKG